MTARDEDLYTPDEPPADFPDDEGDEGEGEVGEFDHEAEEEVEGVPV